MGLAAATTTPLPDTVSEAASRRCSLREKAVTGGGRPFGGPAGGLTGDGGHHDDGDEVVARGMPFRPPLAVE